MLGAGHPARHGAHPRTDRRRAGRSLLVQFEQARDARRPALQGGAGRPHLEQADGRQRILDPAHGERRLDARRQQLLAPRSTSCERVEVDELRDQVVQRRVDAEQFETSVTVGGFGGRALDEAVERFDTLPEVLGVVGRGVVIEAAPLRDRTIERLPDPHADRTSLETMQMDLVRDFVGKRVEPERRRFVQGFDRPRSDARAGLSVVRTSSDRSSWLPPFRTRVANRDPKSPSAWRTASARWGERASKPGTKAATSARSG
jgi:hypothetical protein